MALTADVVANTPILSTWGNETRNRALQVFATIAERTAQWPAPPTGAHSYIVANKSVYLYDGAAWVWMAGAPLGARLTIVGTVNVPNANPWVVAFNTVSFVNGATTATGAAAGITVSETGIYLVTLNVIWNYNGADALSRLSITVDGAIAGGAAGMWPGPGTVGTGLMVANQLSLTAGQKVAGLLVQGSGNAAPVSTDSHLAVVRQ